MTARRLRLVPVVVLVLLVVFGAMPSGAARITLVIADPPNRGFNATQRVSPVQGNAATTLGAQRVAAFAAAAREWERILVSNVDIRVLANWVDLDCSPLSGTLASAGPQFVFRDFDQAPLDGTWYTAAVAQALEQEDLLGNDGEEIGMVFSDAVDGSPGCLQGAEWDYSIGTGIVEGNRISFVDVTRHELAHGLGFTTVVDLRTGAKFLGYDDSFMVNLEDHSLGRTWPELSNPQRATSATDSNGLHWVGGAVQGRSGILSSGVAADSAHVEMYAPATLDQGSSVAHWDSDVGTDGFDELMEAFASSSQANLVTPALLEDVGWGVAYPRAASVADADGNGVDDLAVVRSDRVSGRLSTVVVDPSTGVAVSRSELLRGYASLDLGVVSDFGASAADEVAVLGRNPRTGAVQVFVSDAGTGEVVSQVGFAPDFRPVALAVVPHFGGSPADELALLSIRPRDGAALVVIKDAQTAQSLRTLAFAPSNHPEDLAVLPNVGGGPAAEIAILVDNSDQGTRSVVVRDAASGTILRTIPLAAGFAAARVAAVGASVAVVGVDAGGARVVVVDPGTGAQTASFVVSPDLVPFAVTSLPDFAGTTASEVAVMGVQPSDRAVRVIVADSGSGAELYRINLPAVRVPLDVVTISDYRSSPADEVGVLVATETDFRFRVFVDDPGSGLRLATVPVPTDGEIEAGGRAVEAEGLRLLGAPPVPDELVDPADGLPPGLPRPGFPDRGPFREEGRGRPVIR